MGGARVKRVVVGIVLAIAFTMLAGVPVASAAEGLSPWWGVTSGSRPTNLVPGATGTIVVAAENRGDASTAGEVTIVDRLPPGLRATAIEGVAGEGLDGENRGPVSCTLATLTCTFGTFESEGKIYQETLPPYQQIEVLISVSVEASAYSGEQNTASVSGGGAEIAVSASHSLQVGGTETFGVEDFQMVAENAGGSTDEQAGSHPFQLTSVFTLNAATSESEDEPQTVALPKDIVSELPAGLLADPAPLAQCSESQFDTHTAVGNACPAESAVGVATVTFNESGSLGLDTVTSPIFNVAPLPGEPARFGLKVLGIVSAFLETSIRSGGDYGVRLSASNIGQTAYLLGMKLSFWGDPGDPRHDAQRGWACLTGKGTCTVPATTEQPPLLSLPTFCGQPLTSTVSGDSWSHPQTGALEALASYAMPPLDGCNELPFTPSIHTSPDDEEASRPTGLNLDLHVPQSASANPEGLAESTVRDLTVTLPAGVAIDPAAAGGLQACSEPQIGFTGVEAASGTDLFTAALPEPVEQGLNFCPDAAKIGSVEISTPLLPATQHLHGAVYLATPNANPFSSLLAVYISAEDPISHTLVKLPGEIALDQQTGQITVTFANTPQLSFEDIDLDFYAGERALLTSPAHCGTYTVQASFTPWSGEPPVPSTSSFEIGTGPGGGPCPGASLPFAPSLTAGTGNLNAGSSTALTVTLARDDGQQALRGFQLRLPPGLDGLVSSVPLCPEAQANAGACGAASQIGGTTVSAGVGGEPYTLTGGKVYLTEGYEGAPFGLAIATPVKAGPLDLEDAPENHPACDCLVIRAKIEVDPRTAQLTIATGAGPNAGAGGSGAGGIPAMIDGIPLQIRDLNIAIDRAGFLDNPTSCAPMSLAGTIAGGEGASARVSSSFQLANCADLKFAPKLTVSTSGRTSRQNGAGLHVKLVYPKAPLGQSEVGRLANLASVKVDLPRQLVSRLATLGGACLASVFERDSAACPATSRVGSASVSTPVLPAPLPGRGANSGGDANLSGPAYFVSRGGKRFPELVLVLQGDWVTVDLHGETLIDSAGVTSTTFRTIPDVPVETFELNLPEGSGSALAANGKLCKHKLLMPTALTAHNGAVIHESTKISVVGCRRVRRKARKGHMAA